MRQWAAAVTLGLVGVAMAEQPVTISMMAASLGIPPPQATDTRSLARRAVFDEFHKENPGIQVVNAGGLELQAEQAEVGLLMSMAGDTAPDVFYVNFRQYYTYLEQGFCRPLDDLIGQSPGTKGSINSEVLHVLQSYDGHIYAMPFYQVAQGLYYRKDHFLDAGLDPAKPPRTWAEFYSDGQRLTESAPGRHGFAFSNAPQSRSYYWENFLWQAGGEIVEPTSTGVWKSAIGTPEAAKALDFYRTLILDKWKGPQGKEYGPVADLTPDLAGDIARGKVSMWFSYTNDVVLNVSDVPPSVIGIARMPAGPAGSFNEVNAGMWAINAKIKDPKKLAACWKFIQYFASQQAAKVSAERFIDFGLGNLIAPDLLRKFGHDDIARTVDPEWVKANEELFKTGKPEPYGRNCQQVYTVLDSALDRAQFEKTDSLAILKDVQTQMDRVLLGYTPPDVLARQRAWAVGLLVFGVLAVTGLAVRGLRRASVQLVVAPPKRLYGKTVAFALLCLAPATLSILVWSYYPLLRGLQLAFLDYRVMGGSRWVGLDNFIGVFTQPIFYQSLLNSCVYVGLTIGIGFLMPILLALALNEIPRFGVLFRTLFYLPAMTSPIVIAFLWRQFYDKSPDGLLNSLLTGPWWLWCSASRIMFHPVALNWLGDPHLAMLAVVLPGIWAGAGPGSLLYLAALKNIPDERYEAADLDGADWRRKIISITLPSLRPLILINLLGVFIAGFKAMENVYVMTGGGPNHATQTIGLEIWINAYQFLKFGYATAAAWVLGAILIGFTMMQIKNLTSMRFSAGKA